MDDATLQVPLEHADYVLDIIVAAYAAVGLEQQPPKCSFHIPEHRDQPLESLPQTARHLATRINYAPAGITLLGSVAHAAYTQPLYTSDEPPPPLVARFDKAMELTRRLHALIKAAPAAGAKHPAFAIARQVAAHALDYDCSVLPCRLVRPYAQQLDRAVLDVVAACMDMHDQCFTPHQALQVWLPRRLGGLQVSCVEELAPLARTATLIALGPVIRNAVEAWQALDPM